MSTLLLTLIRFSKKGSMDLFITDNIRSDSEYIENGPLFTELFVYINNYRLPFFDWSAQTADCSFLKLRDRTQRKYWPTYFHLLNVCNNK